MTREEAIAKVVTPSDGGRGTHAALIDTLVALGLLNLDAPKAPYELLADAMGWGEYNTRILKSALDQQGLKVVRA